MTITTTPSDPSPATFSRAGFRRGFVEAAPFIVSNGVAGVVMGVAYRGIGVEFLPSVLLSILVYSATAQAVTLSMWATTPSIAPLVLVCIATNARYLVMGAHLHQFFGVLPKRLTLPVMFLLADASWLMTTADARQNNPDAGYLLGASIPMAIGWIGGTALGCALSWTPSGSLAAAAALLPAAFIVTLLPTQWRGNHSVLPWLLSAAVAAAACWLAASDWAMLLGGATGTGLCMIRGDDA